MTIIICLVGTHYRRPFDGIRYWSKIHGITRLYLLYSNVASEDESNVFSYMSRNNAQELREKLEILDPIMVGYDPMDQRSAFKTIYRIMNMARQEIADAELQISCQDLSIMDYFLDTEQAILGKMDLDARAAGPLANPHVEMELSFSDVSVYGENVSPGILPVLSRSGSPSSFLRASALW